MNLSHTLATHLRRLYTGGNWTDINLKDSLDGLSWQQVTATPAGANSILALVYHLHYFVRAVTRVLQGGPLDAHDKYSFDHPPLESQVEWEAFLAEVFAEAETFAQLIEQLPPERLDENMAGEKYGSYFANLQGIIEHAHYHLGQIVLLKKLLTPPGSLPQ
jgi:uncharacterized damage-inducible protein DinB